MEPLQSNRDLEVLFFHTFNLLDAAYKKAIYKIHLTQEIAGMLAEISRLNNPMPIELSRSSKRTPQTITAILKRMENLSLIARVRNERKKNSYRIHLTKKGLLAYQKILNIDIFYRVTKTFSEEKRIQFRECLEEISVQAKRLTRS